MLVLMIVFFLFLIYVSYVEVVALLFRGKQSNRYFATLVCTVAPVFGSVPGLIMASKYERRVGGITSKMNDYLLRCIIIALQMVSVFMLFAPFFKSDGIYASGIDVIYGLTVGGETIFRSAEFLSFLFIAPFISAVINAVDVKHNIRNIVSYTVSLVLVLTMLLISVYADIDAALTQTPVLWIYAIINVGIMLCSIFSLICVRNKFLEKIGLEEVEMEAAIEEKAEIAEEVIAPIDEKPIVPTESMYKCSKCGNMVRKGEICSCRENKDSLEKILAESDEDKTGEFCVYCHRRLEEGEVCNCVGDGFGITVTREQYEGRKCQYCGQMLVGDSICVCEKIMKKSVPASVETDETDSKLFFKQEAKKSEGKISDELAELEKKIEEQFSKVKDNLSNKNY